MYNEMTLQELTSELMAIQAARAEIKRAADEGDRAEKECRAAIIAAMDLQGFSSFKNGDAQISKVVKQSARVDPEGGWEKLYAHILATGDFDLLHKRLTTTAVQERWESGIVIDGVVPFSEVGLTVRRV